METSAWWKWKIRDTEHNTGANESNAVEEKKVDAIEAHIFEENRTN